MRSTPPYSRFPASCRAPRPRRAVPADPVDFAHWLYAQDSYRMYDYQRESIRCAAPRKCHCDGRDVGKTTEIEITHLHFALLHPRASSLVCAQWAHNLVPTLERLVALCRRGRRIAPFVRRVVRSPFYRIEFANGSLLLGKIAGNRGVNFQNTHVDLISVDEAQNLLDASWDELLPALNAGGRLHVYGVPNGLRNRFYLLTQDAGFAQFHWPSRNNPRFDEAKDAELQRLYGGADSDGYIHNVLGEHGTPSSSAFDFALVETCVEARDEPHIVLYGGDAAETSRLAPVLHAAKGRHVLLGADVGYTRDPTVFVAWAAEGTALDSLRLLSLGIVELHRVPCQAQAALLAALADGTRAVSIACDRGGGGLALLQCLAADRPDLLPRMVRGADGELGIPFGETLLVAGPGGAAHCRMKPATTALYQRLIETRRLCLGRSARLEQMARHTYRLTDRGEIVYAKGNDHILDADRTVLYGLLTGGPASRRSAFRPAVVDGV